MRTRNSIRLLTALALGIGFSSAALAEETVSISKLKAAVTDVNLRVWIIERCTASPGCTVIEAAPPGDDDDTLIFVHDEIQKEIAIRALKERQGGFSTIQARKIQGMTSPIAISRERTRVQD